jgi:hypothetical protein
MDERPSSFIEKFTLPGRLLVIFTMILFGSSIYYVLIYAADTFPTGRYPMWFFIIPVGVGCVLFFGLVVWVLKLCGVKVLVDKKEQ